MMKLVFTVPAWFDEWNKEVDKTWKNFNIGHLDDDHFKSNKIKMLSQVGYGFPLVTDVNIKSIDRPEEGIDFGFSTDELSVVDITKYVRDNRFKLIDAVIHGYEIESN